MVLSYERKGFIRLKKCFRVSKTKDHYQQFDSWCHSHFLLPLFFYLLLFLFFFALLGHTHFILDVTFSSDLGMPPSIWVSWVFMPFWLSHSFSFFFIEIFSCPLVWGVILVGIFSWKKNYSGSKRDRKGCIYFRTWKE